MTGMGGCGGGGGGPEPARPRPHSTRCARRRRAPEQVEAVNVGKRLDQQLRRRAGADVQPQLADAGRDGAQARELAACAGRVVPGHRALDGRRGAADGKLPRLGHQARCRHGAHVHRVLQDVLRAGGGAGGRAGSARAWGARERGCPSRGPAAVAPRGHGSTQKRLPVPKQRPRRRGRPPPGRRTCSTSCDSVGSSTAALPASFSASIAAEWT
jgi:hypothetical protein